VNRLVIFILLLSSIHIHAQKFMANNGEISFFSEALIENISAVNKKVSAVFDISNNDLVFQLWIKDFTFVKALMQEHFNENYLESDIYPNSTFIGKVIQYKDEKAIVQGDLMIHGVTNNIRVEGIMIQDKESIVISSEFIIKLKDYNIPIPRLVMYKIAEEIEIKVNIELKAVK
tara:strand:- start:276 stop:797 length:522 start_codon:yes stop_codon:yes gene_type:complete